MKRQGGFTLIELVVVIVILGILAVTAAPRFLNLQGDAREASLQGLRGAMSGAAGIVYGRSAINGIETTPSVTAASSADNVALTFGYPAAATDGIGNAVEGLSGNNSDWAAVSGAAAQNTVYYSFAGSQSNTTCYVSYQTNASAGAPTIQIVNTGC
ncbi:type II secretion system protein [Vibrio europaeus]|uniref:type II secretion system protein n=1 Tax=Vibrio europaeus TaxID=300876 RepID=UPI00148BA2E8|nr:type II secretion system protein [Vibrio europaeus]MDC5820327.1 type II secretion system GspH family protein [Vibrio europaeus]MDC5841004.1 type II secretion system GspH family protein [Vibrio europaeus]MDC5853400.1 type II secretion system GspH family protein [Vibrio europaeus]MDC5867699.1 type II secretion system GspH family protein [Vibrio europaeus]NOH25287.1 type II secretion system protein [Vibrio europaeus]